MQAQREPAPWLTVWGGKLTTFRLLSQEAADKVGQLLGDERQPWTDDALLPGGDLRGLISNHVHPEHDINEFIAAMRHRYPWAELALLRRWVHAYGSRTLALLEGVKRAGDLGAEVAPGLFERELNYLRQNEWALTADDVLWRRSKLGLRYTAEQRAAVALWMQGHRVEAQRSAA